MTSRFIIIGRLTCPFCTKAIDYCKAKKDFGWEPKTKFNKLIEIMMNYEIDNYE